MCLFKKKKPKIEINSKFKKGELVSFFYRGDLKFGFVYGIKLNEESKVIYDIQIGGECPAIIKDIRELDLVRREKRNQNV